MFTPTARRPFGVLAGLIAIVTTVLASMVSLTTMAAAEQTSFPVTISATPTTGVVDGTVININVDAQSPPNELPSQIFGVEARLCKASSVIDFSADFNPTQTGNCILNALSVNSDAKTQVVTAPPNATAALQFRAGVGSDTYESQFNGTINISCGPADPCKLVLKLQVPGATMFKSFPLTYAGGATAPGAPTGATASAGNASATVTWTAPASNGGAAITGYTVTSIPGGQTCVWTAGPLTCNVAGLTNGTPHTFTVTATNSVGTSVPSAPSNSVTPSAPPATGDLFHALTPARIVDSRPAPETVGPFATPWTAGLSRDVPVTGVGGVPVGADAVVLNVTVTGTTAGSFLTLWPKGATKPTASNLNWSAGQTIPNAVTVKLGTGGQISVFNNSGNVNVIIDVVGYYATAAGAGATLAVDGDGFTSLAPTRILDSRPAPETVGPFPTPWGPGVTRDVAVTGGTTGVPTTASAVVLNTTVTGTTAESFLTVWPKGATKPTASSLNWVANQTIPNAVTVKVGTAGSISVFNNSGNVNVIMDVVGYFENGTGDMFHPLTPARIQDSRPAPETVGAYATPWTAGTNRTVAVTGIGGVPVGATAILTNVTVTSTSAESFLTVYPTGQTKPTASSLNWKAGVTVANAVTAKVGTGGSISMFNNSGSVNVIADVAGWYGA